MAPKQSAPFEPLSPSINIPQLLLTTPNFKPVNRIDAKNINSSNVAQLQVLIQEHVVKKGLPLVLENWHLRADWPKWIFNPDWLKENHGQDRVSIRDIPRKADIPMTLQHYINNLGKLTSKFNPHNYDEQHQRLYGKDLDCPPVWRTQLSRIIPTSTFYLSPQADLMSSLPASARAENMMCYIGHEGTYTPAHKEMCGSLGQNIMVHTSKDGPNSEAGSSIWFMTQMADRDIVAEYWLSTLGHDIEVEAHFASLENLKKAPFTIYIVEQKVGDYVLVPPLAPHQVWNRGTSTMKAAWNRTTVDTLQLAINEALPKARLVCRDEQYKNKSIIYDTLKIYTRILQSDSSSDIKNAPSTFREDYIKLFKLFNDILINECFSPLLPKETSVELFSCDYNVQCSFCRANIFNRFLSCKRCMPKALPGEEDDPYDVCMECYASGRSCFCVSGLNWIEQYPWQSELLVAHAEFRRVVIDLQRLYPGDPPKTFPEELATFPKKPLARICQEAMRLRPVIDAEEEEEPDDNEDIVRKSKNGQLLTCHVCLHKHESWKSAMCTNKNCSKAYCYGSLWRAFDMDPYKDVLAKYDWKCPFCLGICSCGACRRRGKTKPYVPKGTILGIVTKHVADPRSVESLVDFGKGNAGWVGERVMRGRRQSADADGESVDEDDNTLSRWGPTFSFSATNTPANERMESNEDSLFIDESENMQYKDVQNLYKADQAAAGLDVAAIPIDPALGGDHAAHFEEENIPESMASNYARLFEHPPSDAQANFGYGLSHTNGSYNGGEGEVDMSNEEEEIHYFNGLHSGVENTPEQPAPMAPMGPSTSSYNEQFHTMLPSPSAMLTGAAPAAPAAAVNSDENQGIEETMNNNLTTLERNPLAFLAAAGLMHSQAQEREEASRYSNVDNQIHDHRYMDGYIADQMSPEDENYAIEDDNQDQVNMNLAQPRARAGKSRKDRDKVVGDLDMPVSVEDWNWRARLTAEKRSHKKRTNGSCMVVLRISPQAWRRFEEEEAKKKEQKAKRLVQTFGMDQVTTDIRLESTRGRKPSVRVNSGSSQSSPVRFVNNTTQSTIMKRKIRTPPKGDNDDYSSGDEIDLDDGPPEVIKKQTRRSLRTGELVEGLTTNKLGLSSHRRSSSASAPTGKKRGRPSILRDSISKQNNKPDTVSMSPTNQSRDEADDSLPLRPQIEDSRQSAEEHRNAEQEIAHVHDGLEDETVGDLERALDDVNDERPISTMSELEDVDGEQSDEAFHDVPEAPELKPQVESDLKPEEEIVPGTEAYKLVIARALQEAKYAAIRAVERVTGNGQGESDGESDNNEIIAPNPHISKVKSPIQIVVDNRKLGSIALVEKTNINSSSLPKPKKLRPSRPLSHRPGKISKEQIIKDQLSSTSFTPLNMPSRDDTRSNSSSETTHYTESLDSRASKRRKTDSAKVVPQARPPAALRKLLDSAASFTPVSRSRRRSSIRGAVEVDQDNESSVSSIPSNPDGESRPKRGRPPKKADANITIVTPHIRMTRADGSSPETIVIPRRRMIRSD